MPRPSISPKTCDTGFQRSSPRGRRTVDANAEKVVPQMEAAHRTASQRGGQGVAKYPGHAHRLGALPREQHGGSRGSGHARTPGDPSSHRLRQLGPAPLGRSSGTSARRQGAGIRPHPVPLTLSPSHQVSSPPAGNRFGSATIASFTFNRTVWAATPIASAIARSFEEPWQMMQTPSIPSSRAPPNAL